MPMPMDKNSVKLSLIIYFSTFFTVASFVIYTTAPAKGTSTRLLVISYYYKLETGFIDYK